MARVIPGMERILAERPSWLRSGVRVGLLANQASVDHEFRSAADLFLERYPGHLSAIFSPQHGFWCEEQANMQESKDEPFSAWGVPIYSLYSAVRAPTEEMLRSIDLLLVDLQDVGCRVYTYASTLLLCMEAASRADVKIVVADRPNPLGGRRVEGNLLKEEFGSFVGPHPIPMRHGLTLGELAILFMKEREIQCDLEVVPMLHWERGMTFEETELPWVPPSPNMPSLESAFCYPGTVLLEGTNISEGRGTTIPFQVVGAPFIDPFRLKEALDRHSLEGVVFRPLFFKPMWDKWQNRRCGGVGIHILAPKGANPYLIGLTLIYEIMRNWPDAFSWRLPPYEYEHIRMPIDIIAGDDEIRKGLEAGRNPKELEKGWLPALMEWCRRKEEYLIYEDTAR